MQENRSLLSYVMEKYKTLNKPIVAVFEVTYTCNLRCTHCYIASHQRANELTLAEIETVAQAMKGFGIMDITLTGGELFTRNDWYDIVLTFKNMGFLISLFTNATLINREIIDKLLQINPSIIEVSQYGSSPSYYELVSGIKGSFSNFTKGLELLKESGLNFVLKPIVIKQNFSDYEAMISYATANGYRLRFSFCPNLLPNGSGQLDFRLSDEEMVYLFKRDPDLGVNNGHSKCGIGQNGFVVSPTGDIRPCVAYPTSVGNVKEQSLEVVWQGSLVFQELREMSLDESVDCRACSVKEYCQPCLALNLLETGDVIYPKENCRIAKNRKAALVTKS